MGIVKNSCLCGGLIDGERENITRSLREDSSIPSSGNDKLKEWPKIACNHPDNSNDPSNHIFIFKWL